jgi:hypothetical protein
MKPSRGIITLSFDVDDNFLDRRAHRFDRSRTSACMPKPSGRAQFPKFVSTCSVRINGRRESRRREEVIVVLQLIVKSITSLSPPTQTSLLFEINTRTKFVLELPMLSSLASCKHWLCYEAHHLHFGLVIVLFNFLALFWF